MALKNAFENVSTEAKQDTIITAVEAIQTAVEIIDNVVSGSEAQVDVVTLPALAAGTNNIGDVDVLTVPADPFGANADAAATAGSTGSIQAKLRLMTAQLDAIKTAVETIDNVVAGSEAQVDVITLPAIPAGNNNIGDVDIASLPNEGQQTMANSISVALASNQSAIPVTQSGTWDEVGIHDSGNSITVDNGGTFAVQVDGSALTALQLIDDPVLTDDAAFTPATSKVTMAGFQADESSTDSVDEGDAGAARMTLDRKQIVTVEPHTAGGWDVKNCSSSDGATALTNSAQAVKASAGKLGGYYIYNPNATAQFVCIYNVASGSVTVGTTNPLLMLTIPATSAANLEMVNGLTFDTAISVAAASTAGGNGAPSTALDAIFFYK